MQLVNLKPHPVTIITESGTVTIQPEATPARVAMLPEEQLGTVAVNGISVPLVRTAAAGAVTGLPEARDGVLLIVSMQLAMAVPERTDLVVCNGAVRDGTRIVGCSSLARPAQLA